MNVQQGISDDELRTVFTEAGLVDALASAIEAIEGGKDARDRANELANVIFMGAIIEKRDLAGEQPA
jgi:hypothetical protein